MRTQDEMRERPRDRIVLVTGAGSGIGRAVALLAAERGSVVILVDRDADALAGVGRVISETGGTAQEHVCDVSDGAAVKVLFKKLRDSGRVPVGVVTAAGVDLGSTAAHQLPLQQWHTVLEVNLTGSFVVCQEAIASLIEANEGGSIVLVSSPAAFVAFAAGGVSAYSASKGAISALTRSLAVDYAKYGIRVNAIVPGATETPLMWAGVDSSERDAVRARIKSEVPLCRLADPTEPALAALWLLSAEASYVTGSHLVCDGGVLAKASITV